MALAVVCHHFIFFDGEHNEVELGERAGERGPGDVDRVVRTKVGQAGKCVGTLVLRVCIWRMLLDTGGPIGMVFGNGARIG